MIRKGTQRRLAIGALLVTALGSTAFIEQPASAFPRGHKVYNFSYKLRTETRFARLQQTLAPPIGSYTGGIDMVTGATKGSIKLPPVTFAEPFAGLSSITAEFTQVKPVSGRLDLKKGTVTETSTFLMHIVSAYGSGSTAAGSAALPSATLPTLPITVPTLPITLPTLPTTLPTLPVTLPTLPVTLPTLPGSPAVNLVGTSCVSTTPITVIMNGIAKPGSISQLTGTFTIPDFESCGVATALLNALFPGPDNTFTAVAAPSSGPPPTLPPLPITLPTLPITLPSVPVALPTLPITLPTLPITLPSVPVTLPTLPITLPSVPVTLPPVTLPKVTLPPVTPPTLP
ncbi:MAG: hypothetical protein ACLPVY_13725 [Acidimicrobiia bacterium]